MNWLYLLIIAICIVTVSKIDTDVRDTQTFSKE